MGKQEMLRLSPSLLFLLELCDPALHNWAEVTDQTLDAKHSIKQLTIVKLYLYYESVNKSIMFCSVPVRAMQLHRPEHKWCDPRSVC